MKLSAKVLLAILLAWALIIGGMYLGALQILKQSYSSLEEKQVLAKSALLDDAIESLKANNTTANMSYSNWQAIYDYLGLSPAEKAAGKNQTFYTDNFSIATLATPKIDIYLSYDATGNLLHSMALNADRTKIITLPNEVANLFNPGGKLRKIIVPADINSDAAGVISTTKGILVVASHRILPSSGVGVSRGTSISASYLTDAVWSKVKADSKLNLVLYPLDAVKKDPVLSKEYAALLTKTTDRINVNDQTLFLYSLLRDINGDPIAVIKTIAPRDINLLGIKTIQYFNWAFLIIGIAFSLLLFFLLRMLVIKRLGKINTEIVQIGASKDFTRRVSVSGVDELAVVAKEINAMLGVIETVEVLLTDIINSMPSLIILIDKNMQITNLNSLAEKSLGLSSRQALQKSLFYLFPYLEEYKEKISATAQENKTQEITNISFTDQTGVHYYQAVVYPLIRSGEKILALRIDDVSDSLKARQRLEQGDKLAAVGTLTAGVAAEIKEPINFISSAIVTLKNTLANIFSLLQKYDGIKSEADLAEKTADINQLEKKADANNAANELQQTLAGIKERALRIATIVADLKIFTRLDEDARKKANVHEGINATLTLLQHNYKDRIKIIKTYGELPEIDCFPGKLNQVFLNIIANAVEAIAAQGEITIKTARVDNQIQISIKDTGTGIDKENITRIFDPHFTTKSAHTGLGLSIAASIVADHKGEITVVSQPDQGVEFIITLPIS
jgi:PAS domain S-box-containing protein